MVVALCVHISAPLVFLKRFFFFLAQQPLLGHLFLMICQLLLELGEANIIKLWHALIERPSLLCTHFVHISWQPSPFEIIQQHMLCWTVDPINPQVLLLFFA